MAATEIAFAKSFLSLLDTKPTKITSDHIEDPRGYPSSTPYTLPRLPSHPPPPRRRRNPLSPHTLSPAAPGSDPAIRVVVRSPRNPTLDLTLPAPLPVATTSALDVKLAVARETGLPVDKIKLLLSKKPVGDTRTLRELLVGGGTEGQLELGLMVMGGAATWAAAQAAKAAAAAAGPGAGKEGGEGPPPVAPGLLSGEAVLETEAFWGDLKGFLEQRIRDEKVAGEVVERFRGVWRG